ncbi:hypothetical protein Tco_0824058 [Tanacetum coccineum]|uniref:Uncharacterized protein n=1 Tax=Tanacetum coccineum TaxID=301880 RepID=A0ABQ5APQ0_9ASTR
MALCTNLQQRVLDLENTKTTQGKKIASLKRRVKKLEKKRSSRTHKLKRLYKVSLTARVESHGDEEDLGEDASKQGRRINVIDVDDELPYVKPKVKGDVIEEPSVPVSAVSVSTKVSAAKILTLRKGIVIAEREREPVKPTKKKVQIILDEEITLKLQAEIDEEERIARVEEEKIDEANIAWDDIQARVDANYQLAERLKHFAAKRAEERRNKPPTKTKQKKTMITYLKNMEDLVEGSSKRAGTELEQEVTKKQKVDDVQETAEVDNDQEAAKIKELIETAEVDNDQDPDEEEVAIDAIPLAVKSPSIVDWKIHKEGKKSYYQIIRADGKSQMYRIFSQMLKSFDREDLENLYKLIYMLVEKKYPLAPLTLSQMLEKKLQIDYESEMAY